MRRTLFAALAAISALIGATVVGQETADSSKGWRTLFDGKSLDGWEHIGPGEMVLENGTIRTEGGMGLLWYTKEKFGDCVIRVVYKTGDRRANSGVFVRIADKPKDPWYAVHHGYEIQISDSDDDFHGTGAVYSLSKAMARPAKPAGDWNTLEITLKGEEIIVGLNGGEVNHFDPNDKARIPSAPRSTSRSEDRDRPRDISACRTTAKSPTTRMSTSRR